MAFNKAWDNYNRDMIDAQRRGQAAPTYPWSGVSYGYAWGPPAAVIGTPRVGNCNEWISVRTGPSTGSERIAYAYLGDTLQVLSYDDTGDWAYVGYSSGGVSGTGWVKTAYLIW